MTDIETIRYHLHNTVAEPHVTFETLFDEAARTNDISAIEQLVEATRSFLDNDPVLRLWHAHAQAYLALDRLQLDEAITIMEGLRRQGDELPVSLRARVLNNLGIAYEMNEQWDRALRSHHESVVLCEAQHDDGFGLGASLSNLSLVYFKMQEYDEGIACALRSITIFDRHPDSQEWQIHLGTAWNSLGLMYLELEQFHDAQAAFETARTIWTRWQDDDLGLAYLNLGEVHRRLNDPSAARQYYRHAYDLFQDVGYHREAAETLYWLAVLDMHEQSVPHATLFDKALALARSTNNYKIITQILLSRSELQEHLDNSAAALEEARQAVAMAESLRANIVLPDDRARMTASRIAAYERIVSLLCSSPGGYAEAFYHAEMSKSRALVELLAGYPLRPPEDVPQEWLKREAYLRQSLDQLYQDLDAAPEVIVNQEIELHRIREYIRLQDADFQSFQTIAPLTLEEVQERLPANSVLLEYFTVGDTIIVFVVQPASIDVIPLSVTLQDVRRAFTQLKTNRLGTLHHLTPNTDGYLCPAWILRALYQKLLEPLGELIWNTDMLCIVPHGILHHIPFHALNRQTADGLRYLHGTVAEPRSIIYAPSATVLLDSCQRKPVSQQTGCLALGNNNHTLTQAEAEAESIVALLGGTSYTGQTATRAALLNEGPHFRYIHLSCHGRFNANVPTASTLSLTDGALDVTDVLRELRLNAELVTLSACETGYSKVLRGDELIGFIRAFLYAGTPAVLVSQWVVDELSTRLLMERFYHEILHSEQRERPGTMAQALSVAQDYLRTLSVAALRDLLLAQGSTAQIVDRQLSDLAAVAGYGSLDSLRGDECLLAHPYYWAPFFLVGDRLSTSPEQKCRT